MENVEPNPPMGPPPFPDNWEEMTGDEKYQYFIDGYVATEGKPFASPEIAEKYHKRAQRWVDVVALKEPDEVPTLLIAEGFLLDYSGRKAVDTFYNPEKYCNAAVKLHEDMDPSYSVMVMPSSGPALDTLGLKLIRWPGSSGPNPLSDDTPFQYVEDEYMRADEYDELISDPQGYVISKYLPRICSELGGLAQIPNAFNFAEATCITGTLMTLAQGMPGRAAIDRLLKAADQSVKVMNAFMPASMKINFGCGAPGNIGGISFAPYDLIGDTMRCTMAIMKDLYRVPEKIVAAAEALVPMAVDMGVKGAYASHIPYVVLPLHKGADGFMSPAQFEKFYWPSFKATLMGFIDAGLVPVSFVEGSFDQRLEIMAADPLPKGKSVWMFDRTDMKAAKEKIGSWACIGGNVPVSLFKQGSVEMLEDYCKDLIASCGPGGGFFLNPGAVIDHANVENIKAYIGAGSRYGKY